MPLPPKNSRMHFKLFWRFLLMMNHICDGELERGLCNDSQKKSLRKGGIKVDGGHGYIEPPPRHGFVDRKWKYYRILFENENIIGSYSNWTWLDWTLTSRCDPKWKKNIKVLIPIEGCSPPQTKSPKIGRIWFIESFEITNYFLVTLLRRITSGVILICCDDLQNSTMSKNCPRCPRTPQEQLLASLSESY